MFNKKLKAEIAELKKELISVERERDRYHAEMRNYRSNANELSERLEELTKLPDSTPEDCTRGPWCKSCEFVKVHFYTKYHGNFCNQAHYMYACGKGESCKNFVQRKEEV